MEEQIKQAQGKRITCELPNGTMLMGTVLMADDGIMRISDGGGPADVVALRYVMRFREVE